MLGLHTIFNYARLVIFLMVTGLLYFYCGSVVADIFPVTVIDALGRKVVQYKIPERIVTIFSSNTEIVAALGLTQRIVGIDGYTYYPNSIKNVPKIGNRLGFSLDSIVAQNPDLVIMTPARQATQQLIPALDKLGVNSLVVNGGSIETILHNILLIARICGVSDRGKQLVDTIKRRLALIPKLSRCPQVVLITGRVGNGLLLVARHSANSTNAYTADIILKAGGCLALDKENSQLPQLSQVSPEVLLATNPDIILFAGNEAELAEMSSTINGWTMLTAVQTGFVRVVSRAQLLISGPRVIEGVEALSAIFQQWDKH